MTIRSGFFAHDGTPDTEYQQPDFAAFIKDSRTNGVVYGFLNQLEVTATAPATMAVNIDTGRCWIQGYYGWISDTAETVTVTAADAEQDRYDRVIAKLSVTTDRAVTFEVKEGTPGAGVPPALTQTDETWEISLATVFVGAGVASVSDADITDERTFSDPAARYNNDLSMDGNTITDLGDPVNPQDAATRAYVVSHVSSFGPIASVSVTKTAAELTESMPVHVYDIPDGGALYAASIYYDQAFDAAPDPGIYIDDVLFQSVDAPGSVGTGQQSGILERTYNNATGDVVPVYIGGLYRSSWSTNAAWNLNTARHYLAGCGTQSAALSFGGYNGTDLASTEKFDGSSWSTDAAWDLNTARHYLAGCGTQSAALSFGGYNGIDLAVTEKFDGSSWSTDAAWNLTTAYRGHAGCGTQSAALSFGGYNGIDLASTEKFDGSSWSTSAAWDLTTARRVLAGCGTQSAALSFGGYNGIDLASTEKFDGSSWSTSAAWDLTTARDRLAGCGNQSAALSFGGYNGAALAVTEKFYSTFPLLTSGQMTIHLKVGE